MYAVNSGVAKLSADFTKKYGIKVNLWRASSENVLQRVVTEGMPAAPNLMWCRTVRPKLKPSVARSCCRKSIPRLWQR